MDIMELGAMGELVGGVAVIASLIFVGIQLRRSTTEEKLSSVIAERYGAFELFYDYHKSRNVSTEWWEIRGRDTYSSDFACVVDEIVGVAH